MTGRAADSGSSEPTGATEATGDAVDAFDARRVLTAEGLLATFNAAGVLAAADVHVARRLMTLTDPRPGAGEDGGAAAGVTGAAEAIALAAALAVRAPRLGHVCTDLATVSETATAEGDDPVSPGTLPWPVPGAWTAALAASPLVAVGPDGAGGRPLRLVGTRLYLDRYWREERAVADDLRRRAAATDPAVDDVLLAAGLDRLFPAEDAPEPDWQRRAAEVAVRRRLAVVAGGPGTGKTTAVGRLLALLVEQALAAGATAPRVALAAPTGKAAARLEEAVHAEARRLHAADHLSAAVHDRLLDARASTLHRLLGWRPGNRSRFRHDRTDPLPHDVVVVDESSMVSLSLMARLLDAVRAGARLILVGDPDQLASVEAGAVLGDVVAAGSATGDVEPGSSLPAGPPTPAATGAPPPPVAGSIVVLRHVHRYGPELARLAEAIQRGDDSAALAALGDGGEHVHHLDVDLAAVRPTDPRLAPVRDAVVTAAADVREAAARGDGKGALDGLGAVRVLCAHRRGPAGAQTWRGHVERWLADAVTGYGSGGRWYVGRPLLVTENDESLRLHNGDTGVVVAADADRLVAVFERRGELVEVPLSRLAAVETVHAMTIHKAQGSQFAEVAVLLPDAASPLLSRELLYTAVTRARTRVTVVGTADAVRAAVRRPIARASGLGDVLRAAG
jgi:exodeoxyribonuclease V alpha subunit